MHVTWHLPDGSAITATVAPGLTLMEAAVANSVPGVIGECGGNLSCATCHVHVQADWLDRTGPVAEFEDAMLDVAQTPRSATSRLSCQILASETLDGLHLTVPQS